MVLIAHRGNYCGLNPSKENSVSYIKEAIKLGYDVEIDIWLKDDEIWLGHDNPQYPCSINFLSKNAKKLWIHCKNLEAMDALSNFKTFNFFWHQNDDFTLTSKNFIWTYPGKRVCNKSVIVMSDIKEHNGNLCFGICADFLK
jgi:glycerophosphoryl diester phosphodiesterase